ncbi:fatty acid metabolism transcriptional regulator FadR [Catenovulum sp. SM1970]|uniref:fatty acid metabolism transcriptional regulator FadR n=1 Tax=Marinifaba aquimaris TaxID=2741323 RepID=UPI001573DFBC|nr:fatty acid metabolism transcriptional regulator FadR [Marinifaba aquimaris]NTS77006.1 fatty acid metabolism transcriptional regulator FadR [Marinifaba aquimaris]
MFVKAQSPANFAEEYIVESIWNGRFPVDSILPAERELSELIGVTRTTLREVLQRLARDGWLTIQHGKPTKVNNYWQTSGLNILETLVKLDAEKAPQLIDNLLSARTDVCGIYVRNAVKTNPEIALSAFDGLAELTDTGHDYAEFDYQLYHKLAQASDNPIYMLILNGFKGLYSKIGSFYFGFPESRQLAQKFYTELKELVEKGEHEAVLPLIRKHGFESGEIFNQYKAQLSI